MLVDVEGGRAVRFRGDPDHPVTGGFLCGKVSAYDTVVHAENRLLHPLRRDGPKGAGKFRRVTWDEALAELVDRLSSVYRSVGPEALLLYYYAGTMGYVHRFAAEALFNRLGSTRLRQNICYYGADAGYASVVGGGYGLDMEDAVESDLLTVWGANIATTQVHLLPFLNAARAKGAPLWVIDPYRNRTVRQADRWLQVRPGTDAALALGLMHLLDRESLVDERFISERTTGYERLQRDVLPKYSPERVASITGITPQDLVDLAMALGKAHAPLFKVGIGLGRSTTGAAAVRAICCLAGVLGAFDRIGGGVLYDSGCEFRLDLSPLTRPDWRLDAAREMNMTELAAALDSWDDPPIRFLYVHGSNPVATAPLQAQLRRGMARDDLFTVVHERFMTDTATYADLVLPAVTFAESSDLYKSYGHLYLQFAKRAIAPVGESRTNLEVVQEIGRRLGFEDRWFDATVDELVREILQASTHRNLASVDIDRLLQGEWQRLDLPRGEPGFAAGFPTPSGRLEFFSESLAASSLPGIVEHDQRAADRSTESHPLRLLTPPAHAFLNSSFGHSSRSRRRESGEPVCLVHPDDAGAVGSVGIKSGDLVELFNGHGCVCLRANVTRDTLRGVVVAEGTWWPQACPGGRGINELTSDRLTDLGGGSTFHDNYVGLRLASRDVSSTTESGGFQARVEL